MPFSDTPAAGKAVTVVSVPPVESVTVEEELPAGIHFNLSQYIHRCQVLRVCHSRAGLVLSSRTTDPRGRPQQSPAKFGAL